MDFVGTGINSIFILSVVGFVVFLVLLYVHYYITPIFFLAFLPRKETISPPDSMINSQTRSMNSESKAAPEKNDDILSFDKITNFKYEDFTISFDVFLNGQHKTTDSPRVLMYFANNPLNSTFNSLPEDSSLVDASHFSGTNFIVYADPVINDLNVGIVTKKTTTASRVLELAATIKNIPINQPFQITLVVGKTFIEVYKDKRLVKTYRYQGALDTGSATSNKLYSPLTNIVGNTIKIGNVQYFDAPIRSDQVRVATNTLKPKSFFTT
jgi:hypothetical protein